MAVPIPANNHLRDQQALKSTARGETMIITSTQPYHHHRPPLLSPATSQVSPPPAYEPLPDHIRASLSASRMSDRARHDPPVTNGRPLPDIPKDSQPVVFTWAQPTPIRLPVPSNSNGWTTGTSGVVLRPGDDIPALRLELHSLESKMRNLLTQRDAIESRFVDKSWLFFHRLSLSADYRVLLLHNHPYDASLRRYWHASLRLA